MYFYLHFIFIKISKIVCPRPSHHPFLLKGWEGGGGGIEPPTKFSKKGGGLAGSQFLEGIAWKEGVAFFEGGGGVVFT